LGGVAGELVAARPNPFDGVQLVGGSHGDAVQGGNPLIQTIEQFVAGPTTPQSIDAVKTLASGWISGMLAGTRTGLYGAPGQTLDITTDAGTTTAIVLPAPTTPASPTDVILNAVITFATESFYDIAGTLTSIPL
jgi:hypothetical protein